MIVNVGYSFLCPEMQFCDGQKKIGEENGKIFSNEIFQL